MAGCGGEEREMSIRRVEWDIQIDTWMKDVLTLTGLARMESPEGCKQGSQSPDSTSSPGLGLRKGKTQVRRSRELPRRLIKEHDRWVVDQFQSNGQALPLPSREQCCPRVRAGHQSQGCQDLCHLQAPPHSPSKPPHLGLT